MILRRFAYPPWATFGRLIVGSFACYAVERLWLDNLKNVSWIPLGRYPMTLGRYNRGDYPAYQLHDVPDRSEIKIHKANRAVELAGCIAPGFKLGTISGGWAVLDSDLTHNRLMETRGGAKRAEIRVLFDMGAGRI
jgi:hypothetical protein